jgi:phosphopantothenoylcysteine decarboxylase/phosphopantothenate--cysteine ligase
VIVLGVSGSIAAYKGVEIASRLKKQGAQVRVIMTDAATRFVTPLTFRTITGFPVVCDLFAEPVEWNVGHVSLAQQADLFLIAPATANVISKIACGVADDMLTSTILATHAPVLIAPAMNTGMYENPIFQANMDKLKSLGFRFVEPGSGLLACGDMGKGRLAEPQDIVDDVVRILARKKDLQGIKVMVTAGGTREPIDPVRYITNRSSGKMGYALAQRARERGAEVILVSAPTNLAPPPGVHVVPVTTAMNMLEAVERHLEESQVVIKAAAVADYRPARVSQQKIKKAHGNFTLELERNPDILASIGLKKKAHQIFVGFAAETQDLISNAGMKMEKKNVDLMVANDVTLEGAGFEGDTNIVTIIQKDGTIEELPKMSKLDVAEEILDRIVKLLRDELNFCH